MKVMDYIRSVILPCSLVMILSVIITQMLQSIVSQCHVLIIVAIQVLVLFFVEALFGLTKTERGAIMSKVICRVTK